MKFIGDLHVHSKFSRATSKNLDFENLYIFSQLKGITVLGTGDCTHPGWFSEISTKLVPAEPGLFRLKKDIEKSCDHQVPGACRGPVRFMLQSEISNIYKKDGKTRKNHNLVFFPDLDAAARFNQKLERIGNIKSDGRPILGLDARNLLEILLEVDDRAFLVPAHIWTPWFSLLGSKSGFDTVEDCFEDLSDHIFAVETGLSSDPEMNRRVSQLDRMTLISNSDAHSPAKLGREANFFNTDLDYLSIKDAIAAGDGETFRGTIEFYPEQGKYHFDGHRKCRVRLDPGETRKLDGICPVCEKPLTLGVSYRVEMLADRQNDHKLEKAVPYDKLVPLVDILSEILQVGPGSKKVAAGYENALMTLGSEFSILKDIRYEQLDKAGIPFLAEAVTRMRAGNIHIAGGYDGEFGVVKIFSPEERDKLSGQPRLFQVTEKKPDKTGKKLPAAISEHDTAIQNTAGKQKSLKKTEPISTKKRFKLNQAQALAVTFGQRPLLIVAGPGTGKTLTLTRRIAYLIGEKEIKGKHILAVTFTNKAAREMRTRLEGRVGKKEDLPEVATFHSFCFNLLKSFSPQKQIRIVSDKDRTLLVKEAMCQAKTESVSPVYRAGHYLDAIVRAKQNMLGPGDILAGIKENDDSRTVNTIYKYYQYLMRRQALYDFEDLIFNVVRRIENDPGLKAELAARYQHLFVDEYQDINYGQYRIIQELAPENGSLCVIGDPDQSIYGFRGSDSRYFKRFIEDYPRAEVIGLTKNYRSTKTILKAAYQVINTHRTGRNSERLYSETDGDRTLSVITAASETAEAVAIGKTIERLVGGTGFHSIDFGNIEPGSDTASRSFADFVILYRTNSQGKNIQTILSTAGIPCQRVHRETWMDQEHLAELVSLLSVIEGSSNLADIERIRGAIHPGISRKTAQRLKAWFLSNDLEINALRYTVRQFPVAGLTRSRQERLYGFLGRLYTLQNETGGLRLRDKLIYLVENTRLSAHLASNRETQEAFSRLLEFSELFGYDARAFLGELALCRDTDVYREEAEKVTLMTMHAAKGLEFPVVFIAGCDHKRIPYCRDRKAPDDPEEERRLFYVAVTRAREKVFFTYARRGRLFGKSQKYNLSPFVKDIEKGLLADDTENKANTRKPKQEQMKLF